MRHPMIALLGLATVFTFSGVTRAGIIVAPNANASTEGDRANVYPFTTIATMRYQQVYASSQFIGMGGPQWITQILLRPDAAIGSSFTSLLSSVQINLSTTSVTPSTLSTTFASNVGADDKVVYALAPLTLSSSFSGPAGGPKAFDIVINLTTPYWYDRTRGNLLMDVRIFGNGSNGIYDATSNTTRTSRVFSQDVNSATGDKDLGIGGLVTAFRYGVATPEPGSLALAASGALGLALIARARRRR